jgi:hypothetical protein
MLTADMKNTLLTVSLLSAAAALSAASSVNSTPNPSGLVYERIALGYAQNDIFSGVTLSGAAFLGEGLLVGGSYSDIEGRKGYDGVSGELSRFNVGYVFFVGTGDLQVSASYGQGNMYGPGALVVADETVFGISYRQQIVESLEFSIGYARVSSTQGALVDVGGGSVGFAAQKVNGDLFTFALRYNINRQFDVTASYGFQKDNLGGDTLNLSVGYNF